MEKGFGLNPKAVAQRDASFGCRQCMHDVQCPSDFLKVACSQVEYLDIVNCFWLKLYRRCERLSAWLSYLEI